MQGEQQGSKMSVHGASHLHNTLLGGVEVEGYATGRLLESPYPSAQGSNLRDFAS